MSFYVGRVDLADLRVACCCPGFVRCFASFAGCFPLWSVSVEADPTFFHASEHITLRVPYPLQFHASVRFFFQDLTDDAGRVVDPGGLALEWYNDQGSQVWLSCGLETSVQA